MAFCVIWVTSMSPYLYWYCYYSILGRDLQEARLFLSEAWGRFFRRESVGRNAVGDRAAKVTGFAVVEALRLS